MSDKNEQVEVLRLIRSSFVATDGVVPEETQAHVEAMDAAIAALLPSAAEEPAVFRVVGPHGPWGWNDGKPSADVAAEIEAAGYRIEYAYIPRPASARPSAGAGEAAPGIVWHNGAPPKPWAGEWFLADTTSGPAVLRALPEEYSYDFKTADDTYIKAANIKRWAQLPDSEFIAPVAPAAEGWQPATTIPGPAVDGETLGLALYIDKPEDGGPNVRQGRYDHLFRSFIDSTTALRIDPDAWAFTPSPAQPEATSPDVTGSEFDQEPFA